MSTADTKKPASNGKGKGQKKPRPSESVKDRPKNVAELTLAIQQDRLDNRTLAAKQITQAREVIGAAPLDASKALCIDSLAQTVAILTAITNELSKPGNKVLDESGNLNPLIADSLFRTQDSMRKTIGVLVKLEGLPNKAPAKPDGEEARDVTSMILDAQGEVKGDEDQQ